MLSFHLQNLPKTQNSSLPMLIYSTDIYSHFLIRKLTKRRLPTQNLPLPIEYYAVASHEILYNPQIFSLLYAYIQNCASVLRYLRPMTLILRSTLFRTPKQYIKVPSCYSLFIPKNQNVNRYASKSKKEKLNTMSCLSPCREKRISENDFGFSYKSHLY